jgi:proteic killer suppression protein
MEGSYAVVVRANWRVTFRFAGREALDVDYIDYH